MQLVLNFGNKLLPEFVLVELLLNRVCLLLCQRFPLLQLWGAIPARTEFYEGLFADNERIRNVESTLRQNNEVESLASNCVQIHAVASRCKLLHEEGADCQYADSVTHEKLLCFLFRCG